MSTLFSDYWTVGELAAALQVSRQRTHVLLHQYDVPVIKPHTRLTLVPAKHARHLLKLTRPNGKHRVKK